MPVHLNSVMPGLDLISANLNNYLNSVIPGLDPGTSFHRLNGEHPDFGLKSSCPSKPGGTRIKSGYDGIGEGIGEVPQRNALCQPLLSTTARHSAPDAQA